MDQQNTTPGSLYGLQTDRLSLVRDDVEKALDSICKADEIVLPYTPDQTANMALDAYLIEAREALEHALSMLRAGFG